MDIAYSREGAGALLGLIALGVARGLTIDDAAARAHEMWSREVLERGSGGTFSAEELAAIAREASGG